jgi:hypothetical protein
VLPGHQTEPRSHLATRFEDARVANTRDYRRGGERADAWNSLKALARRGCSVPSLYLPVDTLYLGIELEKVLDAPAKKGGYQPPHSARLLEAGGVHPINEAICRARAWRRSFALSSGVAMTHSLVVDARSSVLGRVRSTFNYGPRTIVTTLPWSCQCHFPASYEIRVRSANSDGSVAIVNHREGGE